MCAGSSFGTSRSSAICADRGEILPCISRCKSERMARRGRSEKQPHLRQIGHATEPALRSEDEGWNAVPFARDAQRSLPDARGKSPGPPIGTANARTHGLYTAAAVADRRELAALMRLMARRRSPVVARATVLLAR